MDDDAASKYCFNSEDEAWSLAINKHGVAYMKLEQELENDQAEKKHALPDGSFSHDNIGFDFSAPSGSNDGFNFTSRHFTPSTAGSAEGNNVNPFVFGSYNQHDSPGWYKKVFFLFHISLGIRMRI